MNNLAVWLCLHTKHLSLLVRMSLCLGGVIVTFVVNIANVFACELKESSSAEPEVFRRHLVGFCTSGEREAFAISADLLFQALQDGKSLDLRGVTIVGDLMLDQLPLQPMNATSLPSVAAQQIVAERHIQNGRIIQRSLSIRDAVIKGNWATNLRNGILMIMGDTLITGTTFQQSIDFSQTVFLKTVNFSNSVILYEGFFIRAHFEEQAIFDGVVFGTHSRFHKARFNQNASFLESRFNGLAEFLEVVFEKRANFAKAQFQMGTGFSGTQFDGLANFSEAQFTREAFFRFAVFRQEANFRDTTFREVSDFTSSEFDGITDFKNVEFLVPPNFSGTSLEDEWKNGDTKKFLREKLAIGLAFLGLLCFLIWGVRKWKQTSS